MENWKRTFFTIWAGQAISMIGSQMVHFAIAWWLTQQTGSAVALVTVAIFGSVPSIVLGPFIGALVDRWDRRRVMIISDAIIALVTLWLALMFFSGNAQVWFLYITAFIRGTLGTFHYTSMTASTSLMVPKEHLARVSGMNQTLQGILNIATPPLGALVVVLLPIWGVMFIDVGTAALAILPLLFVHIPRPENMPIESTTPSALLRDVREGLRYVGAWPGLLLLLCMATLINFLWAPASTLMPLLVAQYFKGTAWHLSAVESAFGIGMIAGGITLSVWGGFKKRIVTSLVFLVLMGAGGLLTGFTPRTMFWMLVAAFGVTGFANVLVNGPLFAILQARIAPEMQGRVFTLVSTVSGAMVPFGMALAAPVADHLGVRVWWWLGGAACILMAAAGMAIPAIMEIETDARHGAAVAPQPAPAD